MTRATRRASCTVAAHGKVNLLLRILAREASGFHGIETLFQRVALHDVVTVEADTAERALACDGPALPAGGLGAPEANLAWRAAQAYAEAARWDTGWRITIAKHIPVGGGLGGGSADAAAVLHAMERLAPAPLGPGALLELAGTLGSDVPFLALDTSRAWAWGRGDRLLALPALPPMAVTLVAFDRGVDTGRAYRAVAAAREGGLAPVTAAAYAADAFGSWEAIAAIATNDFEHVVPQLHDGVAAWLPRVRAHAEHLRTLHRPAVGMLSGSGATCFLLAPDPAADAVTAAVPALAIEPGDAPGVRLVATHTA
jgi:4-diphosphocytidyl-2-C-methyl-D-erythritol kinase